MRSRNISARNFWGGFWGGVLGILAAAWIHTIALPIGCLIGVTVGFWYQEIYTKVRQQYRNCMFRILIRYLHIADYGNAQGKRVIQFTYSLSIIGAALRHKARIVSGVLVTFFNVKQSPIVKWVLSHRMHRAYCIRIIVVVIFLGLHAPLVSSTLVWGVKTNAIVVIFTSYLGFVLLSVPIELTFDPIGREFGARRSRLETYKRYCNKGPAYFLMYDFIALIRTETAVIITILWALAVAGIFLCAIVPTLMAALVVHSVYHFSTKTQHWLCYSVTLAVTIGSAWLTHDYLSGIQLWLIALTTGCISGIAVETVRRLASYTFKKSKALQVFATTPIGKCISPIAKWGSQVFDKADSCLSSISLSA